MEMTPDFLVAMARAIEVVAYEPTGGAPDQHVGREMLLTENAGGTDAGREGVNPKSD